MGHAVHLAVQLFIGCVYIVESTGDVPGMLPLRVRKELGNGFIGVLNACGDMRFVILKPGSARHVAFLHESSPFVGSSWWSCRAKRCEALVLTTGDFA